MSGQPQEQKARRQIVASKLVVATRRGYWGTQIKDPDGSETERAPFRVPADLTASWFEPVSAAPAEEADIG
jgi:hypothetical protein